MKLLSDSDLRKGLRVSETDSTGLARPTLTVGDEEQLVQQMSTLGTLPLGDRVRTLSAVHEQLTQALTELDHL